MLLLHSSTAGRGLGPRHAAAVAGVGRRAASSSSSIGMLGRGGRSPLATVASVRPLLFSGQQPRRGFAAPVKGAAPASSKEDITMLRNIGSSWRQRRTVARAPANNPIADAAHEADLHLPHRCFLVDCRQLALNSRQALAPTLTAARRR